MNSQRSLSHVLGLFWPSFPQNTDKDRQLTARIRRAASSFSKHMNGDLSIAASSLRCRMQSSVENCADEVVVQAFGLAVEAVRRVLAIDLYDVQLLGGIALTRRAIAQMQTGEGKTYSAILPAVFHGLLGKGVHVMTVNPYLARRDFELLAPVYQLLGLTVGLVECESDADQKRAAYACDITYGPGYEFGFDYLRDQIAGISQAKPGLGEAFRARQRGRQLDQPRLIQRGLAAAIVDEADSVMIDEATTPLVLAIGGKQTATHTEVYELAEKVAAEFESGRHFVIEQAASRLEITEQGLQYLCTQSSAVPRGQLERPWAVYVEQALRAQWLFKRDVEYVVVDGVIQLVDQQTGRILQDRSWRDGLEQAIQTKEGVTVTTESKTVARISRQRCLRVYKHLCGMTGTAEGAECELRDVYGLNVMIIPLHKPCVRQALPTRFFSSLKAKEQAIVADVTRLCHIGRPVLVGTTTVASSERLAEQFQLSGIRFQLLNGKQDAAEAHIIARAGQHNAVTIATNMAGRGTDIKLGVGVAEIGGLHVIAAEPQESARAQQQLVGRAARQGDPGSSQLFASADDAVFQQYSATLGRRIRELPGEQGEVTVNSQLAAKLNELQRHIERDRFRKRQLTYGHDDWLEKVMHDLV